MACTFVWIAGLPAVYSAARLRRLSSPSTGYTTCRTVSSGRRNAASATFSSRLSLLETRVNWAAIWRKTFFSARSPAKARCKVG